MIRAKRLIELLSQCPPESAVVACDSAVGEEGGLIIECPDGSERWIRAGGWEHEDDYTEGFDLLEPSDECSK